MAETTVLRTSAIVQNASVGTSKPPLVSTGALSQVQVKMTPAGPQVQEGQTRPVQMLPPNSRGAAVQTGALPMVQVRMTQNGPQSDDGQNRAVVIKDSKHGSHNAGGLPMVQVRMDGGKPQVQTVSNVHGGPPQIPAAAPVLSQPRVARIAAPRQVQVYPQPQQLAQQQLAQPQQFAQPQAHGAVQLADLSIDQVLFLRHLVDKYLGETQTGTIAADTTTADNIKLADDTIFVFDRAIAAASSSQVTEGRAEVLVSDPVVVAVPVATAPVRVAAVGYVAPAAYAPMGSTAPRRGFVAPRPDGRRVGVRTGNASLAPRRMSRGAQGPLPMVQVKMDGRQAVVQNQAEIAAVKQAQAQVQAEAEALVAAAPPIQQVVVAEVVAAEVSPAVLEAVVVEASSQSSESSQG